MATSASNAPKNYVAPPLSAEDEDALVYARLANDEKALRRVIKKFHAYTSVSHTPNGSEGSHATADDARDAFLTELASFELSLQKNVLVCEAEARQVEEYERERSRIADEDEKLRGQIEQLKTSLEHEQMVRRRKIEYDGIATQINVLPSRDELSIAIQAHENDMAAIRAEQATQDSIMQAQRLAVHEVVQDIAKLRFIGKDPTDADGGDTSRPGSPAPDAGGALSEREDGEADPEDGTPHAPTPTLNPGAKAFVPGGASASAGSNGPPSRTGTPVSAAQNAQRLLNRGGSGSTPAPPSRPESPAGPPPRSASPKKKKPADDDIEMGEVEEDGAPKKAREREEPEEGEATDASSELTDLSEED